MYLAMGTVADDTHHGSTRLHLDMSDAVNIMVHSTPANGTALWHIFARHDAPKIREFIRELAPSTPGDPIHCQKFYLGPELLTQLSLKYQVKPFTIRQRVNQAVFIPAGCAHQVNFLVPSPINS